MKVIEMHIFGGQNLRNTILDLLKRNHIEFQHLVHEKALTSDEGVEKTNYPKEKGIKALIVKGKQSSKRYLIAILGHQKIDWKILSKILGEKCELESLDNIKEHFGLEQGGATPFGNLLKLKTFFDESILELDECIIGAGLSTESIILHAEDLIKLVRPEIYKIAK